MVRPFRFRDTATPPDHETGEGFVTPDSPRDHLAEYVYRVPSRVHLGRMASALRIEAGRDYIMPETLDMILDFAEWAIQQQKQTMPGTKHPNRPQLVGH